MRVQSGFKLKSLPTNRRFDYTEKLAPYIPWRQYLTMNDFSILADK